MNNDLITKKFKKRIADERQKAINDYCDVIRMIIEVKGKANEEALVKIEEQVSRMYLHQTALIDEIASFGPLDKDDVIEVTDLRAEQ